MKLPTLSFRARILLVVAATVAIPLGLIGLWLTRTSARSGEELLRRRLERTLERSAAAVGENWVTLRSELLTLVDDPAVRAAVRGGGAGGEATPRADYGGEDARPEGVRSVVIRAPDGAIRWSLGSGDSRGAATEESSSGPGTSTLTVEMPYFDRSGERLGTLRARVAAGVLLAEVSTTRLAAGGIVAAFDRTKGTSLLPLPLDPALLTSPRFTWAGEEWVTRRRPLAELGIELVAAGPVDPFTAPFREAARRATWIVLAVGLGGLALAALVTGRLTRSLERLAVAATAVSHGDLDRRVAATGNDEVGQVARAFNAMTESLQETLRELADRRSLAAVGEFASVLAHEVRSPVTSVRMNLQMVQERLDSDSPLHEMQQEALREIDRLDRTVRGVLQVARSGEVELVPLDLREPVEAGARAARSAFERRGVALIIGSAEATHPGVGPEGPVRIRGEPGALEQLFLNLLLNAAEAAGEGGRVRIGLSVADGRAAVTVEDDGPGIPPERREEVFRPFRSTRTGGTGLGLAIARRIATAHGATIEIGESPLGGAALRVTFPVAEEDGEGGGP